MKYYLIHGTHDNGHSTAIIKTQGNKYEAIKKAREYCPAKNYIPVIVKRISKRMYLFVNAINKTEGE